MSIKQPIFGRALFLDTAVTAGNLVSITSDESVSLCTAGIPDGVAWSDGEAGDKITVELFGKGIVEVVASATINAGESVEATTGGEAVKAATGYGFGKALTTGSADGVIKVLVK